MENFPISQTESGLHIDGVPDAVALVSIRGHKAQRLSDLALHQSDLKFALEALETLSAPGCSIFVQEALWRAAIIHYIKCFGDSSRFSLSESKLYKSSPPEALEAFRYFKELRNRHISHDENSYAQSIPGAAINNGKKDYKIEKIMCLSFHAQTLEQANYSNLHLLISDALFWVNGEFDKVCDLITKELETIPHDEIMSLPRLNYRTPEITDAYAPRDKFK